MQKLPGVAKVDIDADARTATVSVEAGTFSAADAVDALKSRGFPADTVKAIEVASAEGAKAPDTSAEDPADNAAAPAEDAEAPAETTDAPAEAPATDAEAPAESTEAPAKEAEASTGS